MQLQTLIAGFGGQGILLMGQLLAEAAMDEGFHATWFPSYGPEMRGGTANCATIIADEEIGAPISRQYDAVIVMNEPSQDRFASIVRPGGLLLANDDLIPVRCARTDIESCYVPASRLAREAGNERTANVVILGALLALRPSVSPAALERAIQKRLGAKKPEALEANFKALRLGAEHVHAAGAPVGCR
ncbi:MAG: 2-oxoglutarate ferredoxin oxidoreductase subunit gamma [Planctomycetota bacterium]